MEHPEYFESYADVEVHRLMLRDLPRTGAYKRAIEDNAELFKDKVVLDVGAGTGILSLFAASAGARKVFAVEGSDIAVVMRQVVKDNGLEGTIEVLNSAMEEVQLSEKVDVIVSEWMGFYLLHESMLGSVIHARDNWLKDGGLMFPSKASIHVSLGEMSEYWEENFNWTEKFCGFNFSALQPHIQQRMRTKPVVTCISQEQVSVCESAQAWSLDLMRITEADLESMLSSVTLKVNSVCEVHAFVCWFDVEFPTVEGKSAVVLSTAPHAPQTHWKQCAVMLPQPIETPAGLVLNCEVALQQGQHNKRFYLITVEVLDAHVSEE